MKLINTHKDYLLLVDEPSFIPVDVWCYSIHTNKLLKAELPLSNATNQLGLNKIIAHLPLHDNASVLEGVPLLPELPKTGTQKVSYLNWQNIDSAPKDGTFVLVQDNEGEIHKAAWLDNRFGTRGKPIMAWSIADTWGDEQGGYHTITPVLWSPLPKLTELPKKEDDVNHEAIREHFKQELKKDPEYILKNPQRVRDFTYGYKAASQKRWSDDDLRKVVKMARTFEIPSEENGYDPDTFKYSEDEILQSLSPVTLPVGFKPEYETKCYCGHTNWCDCEEEKDKPFIQRYKTIKSTFRGKEVEQLIGGYVYE